MYQLIRSLSRQSLVLRQLPVFGASFALASLFYKFGSFALECLAFVATWFALDLGVQGVIWAAAKLRPSGQMLDDQRPAAH